MATLWLREMVRFFRQRSRVVGALVQPLVFWLLLGGGLQGSFRPPGAPAGMGYGEYSYPGILAMVLLFTAIFATISVVEDRQRGFLQGVLVAPVPRSSIVLGQALGCTTLGVVQGLVLLPLAPLVGIPLTVAAILQVAGVMVLVAFGLTSLSLAIAWQLDSTQGFHAIMTLVLLPMWLLSGAFFPTAGAPVWLLWAMRVNPLTYGLAAIRRCLYLGNPSGAGPVPALAPSVAVAAAFAGLAFLAAVAMAVRKRV
ncbi:MAG: ABC transporter permease [candidate division NC10 bacterium]|nr:ABC transporter permease [candidate division NC10 bacterium]